MLRSRKDSHRDFLRSQSIIRKRRKKTVLALSLRVLLLVLIVIGIVYVLRLDSLQIKKVIVVGSDSVAMEKIKQSASSELDGHYMYLVPKRNALFYPKQKILTRILLENPHVKELTMNTEGFDILNIKLTERQPVMEWCKDACFNMDEHAFVYEVEREGESYMHIQGGDLGTSSEYVGKYAFDEKTFKMIKDTANTLASSSLPVDHISFVSPDEIKYYIKSNGYIVVSGRRPLDESMGNLNAALKSSRFSVSPQFEYIDTRFGNKVFLKVKDVKGTSTKATSTPKH